MTLSVIDRRNYYTFNGQSIAIRIVTTGGIGVNANDGLYFIHNDHLGSASVMSSNTGSAVLNSQARYLPFGDWRTEPTAELTDRGYTSHKHNNMGSDDIGLIYMNARYYVPGIARFASADTLIPDPHNPQSYNRFSYVENRPLNFIDPSGHCKDTEYENDYNGCIDWLESSYGIDINIWQSEEMQLLWALHESLNLYLSLLGNDLFMATYGGVVFNYLAPNTPAAMDSSFGGVAGNGTISFYNNPDIISSVHQSLGIYDTYLNLVLIFAHEMPHFVVNPSGANTLATQGIPGVFEEFLEASGWMQVESTWVPPTLDEIEGTQATFWVATAYALETSSNHPVAEDAAENLAVSLVLGQDVLHPASVNILQIVQQVVYDWNWESNYNPKSGIMQ